MSDNIFPSYGELPFRTAMATPPVIKSGAVGRHSPQTVSEADTCVLDLSQQKDVDKLRDVMEQYGFGSVILHTFEKVFCQETGNWKVFLVYFKMFREMPDETETRLHAFYGGGSCL